MRETGVIVVGAGHAGCEAASAAARSGVPTVLITFRRAHVARLSCNPAFGGLAKGQLVRELDALGGLVGRVTDAACIQFRRLNTRKGLAVQGSRAQVDSARYPAEMLARLEATPGLEILEAEVAGVRTRGGRVVGVTLGDGTTLDAPAVVLTTGTFLGATMHRGLVQEPGGRIGDPAAERLSASLADLGLRLGRLKTGTPPRLRAGSIDFSRLELQTDLAEGRFSFGPPGPRLPRRDCWLTYTNPRTHEIIRSGLDRSPMYTGAITGVGPRYCPSVEDKVTRFADRDRHLLFLEPEGLDSERIYVNGLSTSLPEDVQLAALRSIEGLEACEVLQWGYAVEYDFADPTDLGPDLSSRSIPGLWLAGQVNGTSGYEEAAAQGFVAGISAARGPFVLGRSQAYVGVLVDDLVTRGVGGEPYRMFTSRAEHRLLLREDNADRRLMPIGRSLGLIDDATWAIFEAKRADLEVAQACLDQAVTPTLAVQAGLEALGESGLRRPTTVGELLRRPTATWAALAPVLGLPPIGADAAEQIEIDAQYGGYVAVAEARARDAEKMEAVSIPADTPWETMGLSNEAKAKLSKLRPTSLGQLQRVPGITPAVVQQVAAWLARARVARVEPG